MKLISENRFKKDLANIILFILFIGNDEAFAFKVLSKESIKTPATSNYSFTSKLAHILEDCLKRVVMHKI